MSKIDESYVVKQYGENFSTYSIAKELDTYPKKIERILSSLGVPSTQRKEQKDQTSKNLRSVRARPIIGRTCPRKIERPSLKPQKKDGTIYHLRKNAKCLKVLVGL